MSIDLIKLWHERARPHPTERDLDVQVGCHFEEVVEMLETLTSLYRDGDGLLMRAHEGVVALADALKSGQMRLRIKGEDRQELLDSLADQIVTATGVGHCAGMNITEAVRRVNTSIWTKYDSDGQPMRDKNGKISKGPNYAPPDLEGLY